MCVLENCLSNARTVFIGPILIPPFLALSDLHNLAQQTPAAGNLT